MKPIDQYLSLESLFTSGMSIFQMDNFVINDHITPYRKLKQAMVEARARLENITSIGFDIEELELKKAKADTEHDKTIVMHDKQLLNIQIRRFEFELNRKKAILDQCQKEADFFLGIIEDIVSKEFISNDLAIAKLSDPKYQEEQERVFWTKKLMRSVFSDLINYGTISKGLMESILCLPIEQQKAIIDGAMLQHVCYTKQLSDSKQTALVSTD